MTARRSFSRSVLGWLVVCSSGAAAQPWTRLDLDAECARLNPGWHAEQWDAGNPGHVVCTPGGSDRGAFSFPPTRMCQRRQANLTAVLLDRTKADSWVCAEPGAELPEGSIDSSRPAPAMERGGPNPRYAAFVRKHFRLSLPTPLVPALDRSGASAMQELRGPNLGVGDGDRRDNMQDAFFGRHVLVLIANSATRLQAQSIAVDAIHQDLVASAPDLAASTSKVVLFPRGTESIPTELLSDLRRRRFALWINTSPSLDHAAALGRVHQLKDGDLALVDAHGYVRAATDPAAMLRAADSPDAPMPRSSQWMGIVYGRTVRSDFARQMGLAELLDRTTLSGHSRVPTAFPRL